MPNEFIKESGDTTKTLEDFFQAPSEELLENIRLKTFRYAQLVDLTAKLSDIYGTNPIIQKLYLKCLTRIAKLEIQHGKLEKAEEYLNKALGIEPENSITQNSLGSLETHMGNYKKAEELLKGAFESDPSNVVALGALGNLEIERGDYNRAEEYLNQALKIDPDDIVAKHELINAYILNGKSNKADILIKDLMQSLPIDAKQRFLILCAFYKLHPDHPLWPELEKTTGFSKEEIADVANSHRRMSLLKTDFRNSLWDRTYISTPINTQALHGIKDMKKKKLDLTKYLVYIDT